MLAAVYMLLQKSADCIVHHRYDQQVGLTSAMPALSSAMGMGCGLGPSAVYTSPAHAAANLQTGSGLRQHHLRLVITLMPE